VEAAHAESNPDGAEAAENESAAPREIRGLLDKVRAISRQLGGPDRAA
jgi:hypothetical protein